MLYHYEKEQWCLTFCFLLRYYEIMLSWVDSGFD